MLAQIPPPELDTVVLLGAGAVCVIFAAAALLWGRTKGRLLMAVLLIGAGAACTPLIVKILPLKTTWVIALCAGFTGGVIGFALARVLWAVALGATLAIVAVSIFAVVNAGAVANTPAWRGETGDIQLWASGAWRYVRDWMSSLWGLNQLAVAACAAGPIVLAVVGWALLPRATVIVASSVLGAVALVGGAALFVWAGSAEWAARWIQQFQLTGAAAGVFALGGVIVQTRGHIKDRPRESEEGESQGASDSRGRDKA